MVTFIHHPDGDVRLGDLLIENLTGQKWRTFKAAVAFVKRSGTKHLASAIKTFVGRGDLVQLSVGIDQGGTSAEGLQDILDAIGENGRAFVFHNAAQFSFHPKVYLFRNQFLAECFVGSGNLTEGGLYTNYEAFVRLTLETGNANDDEFLRNIEARLDDWANPDHGTVRRLTRELVSQLQAEGLLPTEAQIRERNERTNIQAKGETAGSERLFAAVAVKPAPRAAVSPAAASAGNAPTQRVRGTAAQAITSSIRAPVFLMTLQNTDVGVGQTTAGTAKRSPEIFIPIGAVRQNPAFWGWPDLFKSDPSWTKKRDREGRGKMDREAVRMLLGSKPLSVNWWYNPDKVDIRMRNSDLRDAGSVGDIMRIEKTDGAIGYDYSVRIIKPSDIDFAAASAACSTQVRPPSKKRYGYL